MKKSIILLVTLLMSNLSHADSNGVYVRADLAVVHSSVRTWLIGQSNTPILDSKDVAVFPKSLGLGYKFNDMFRVDANLSYIKFILGNNMTTTWVNGYWDVKVNDFITPYVTAGLGGVKWDIFHFWKLNNMLWNVGVGANIRLTKNLSADIGYRYVNYRKAMPPIQNYEGLVGLIYRF